MLLARPLAHVLVLDFSCVRTYLQYVRMYVQTSSDSMFLGVCDAPRARDTHKPTQTQVRGPMRPARQFSFESMRHAMVLSDCESVRLGRPLALVFALVCVCLNMSTYVRMSMSDVYVRWCFRH